MLGDTVARWWLDEHPGRMTIGRAAWVVSAVEVMLAALPVPKGGET